MEFLVKSFVTLFVVMDPVGLVPVFLALAGHYPPERQARIARKAVLVAGGLLLFKIATEMVFGHHERETEEEAREALSRSDISVFPLAIPLIAGPGALASLLILGAEARGVPFGAFSVLLTAFLVLLLAYLFLRGASVVRRALGRTGVNVVTRVLGILLAALAVQYVADGVRALL